MWNQGVGSRGDGIDAVGTKGVGSRGWGGDGDGMNGGGNLDEDCPWLALHHPGDAVTDAVYRFPLLIPLTLYADRRHLCRNQYIILYHYA